MTLLEAISERRSRRLFLQLPVDELVWEHLLSLSEDFSKKSGLSILLIKDGSFAFSRFRKTYGLFSGVRSLIVLSGNPSDSDLLEKAGYFGEWMILEATRLGLGTCWVGGSFDHEAVLQIVPEGQSLVAVIPIGNVEDLSFKEKLVHQLVAGKSKSVEQLLINSGQAPSWILDAMKAVQKAPSAANKQPVQFVYDGQSVRATVQDSQRFSLIDLGIAKLHFSLAAGGTFEWGNNSSFHKK